MKRVLIYVPFLCIVMGSDVLAQNPITTFPFETTNAEAVALGTSGSAVEGMQFRSVNPAAAARSHSGFDLSISRAPQQATTLTIGGMLAAPAGALFIQLRSRDWGEVAKDLGLSGLRAAEQAVTAGYGISQRKINLGISGEFLHADYLGTEMNGYSLNAGAQIRVNQSFNLGLSFLQFAGSLSNDEIKSELPANVRVGLAYTRTWKPGVDFRFQSDYARFSNDGQVTVGGAFSYDVSDIRSSLRVGAKHNIGGPRIGNATRYFAGGGLRLRHVEVDITRSFDPNIGSPTFISLSLGS